MVADRLSGEYRIIRIGDHIPQPGHEEGMLVTISADRIHYRSECIYADWEWRVERGVIYTDRYAEPGAAMCARALSDDELAAEGVFDSVRDWTVGVYDGIAIHGPRDTLVLRPLSQEEDNAVFSMEDLVGEYRVAGIDGMPLDGNMGIALSISESRISFEPECLGFVWRAGVPLPGLLQVERDPTYGSQRTPGGSLVSCQPSVTPEFGELASALDQVDRVTRTEENGIELSGSGRSVLLFTQ